MQVNHINYKRSKCSNELKIVGYYLANHLSSTLPFPPPHSCHCHFVTHNRPLRYNMRKIATFQDIRKIVTMICYSTGGGK